MAEDERTSNFKWSLQVEDLVLSFQHILQGEIIEPYTKIETMPDGSKYAVPDVRWAKKGEPLLEQVGIQQLTTMLYAFLNRNVFLSNLSETRAMRLARDVLLMANDKLFLSAEEFGLKSENYSIIITELEGQIVSGLLRPFEEGERKFQARSSTEVSQRMLSERQGQGSSGVFGNGR